MNCKCGCGKVVNTGKKFVTGHNSWTHRMAHTPTYRTWKSMLQRTTNPRTKEFPRYGGRGIKVCRDWLSFENFFDDMGIRPRGLSLDRIDNDGPYSPENCRWATRSQQMNNTPLNHIVCWNGKNFTVTELALLAGLTPNTLLYRLRRGWSIERAVTQAKQRRHAAVEDFKKVYGGDEDEHAA